MLIHKSSKLLIASLVVFATLLLFGAIYLYFSDLSNDANKVSENNLLIEDGPCSNREIDGILSEAVPLFLPSAFSETNTDRPVKLLALEERIVSLDNYLNDANCLHILTMIYNNRGDLVNSEKYFTLLADRLGQYYPESYILDENVNFDSIEEMRVSIENIRYNEKLQEENNPFKGQNRLDEKID